VQLAAQLFGPAPGIVSVYFVSADTLIPVGCDSNFGAVTFSADSGSEFFFQISASTGATGPTVFTLQQDTIIPPPPPPPPPPGGGNDNFADARLVPGVPPAIRRISRPPRSRVASNSDATSSGGRCGMYSVPRDRAVQVSVQESLLQRIRRLVRRIAQQHPRACPVRHQFQIPRRSPPSRGRHDYIQVLSDQPGIAIVAAPHRLPGNFTQPFDPSSFDVVQFYDQSYDPGGRHPAAQWDFGDGATGVGFNPTHRYAADGDYRVSLTVTTFDGRTGSITRTLQVRTHDVAITRFATPASGMAGKTAKISVDIRSNRLPETVQVQLFKSVPGGFQLVAVSQQTLPTRNRVTSVAFSYTFTPDDAIIGKVTFRAVALLVNARDALPADNEAIGSPTKVMK
jgi:hypothetical protein